MVQSDAGRTFLVRPSDRERHVSESIITAYDEVISQLTDKNASFALTEVIVKGRRLRTFANTSRNLGEIFSLAHRQHAASPLIAVDDHRFTYNEIFAQARC
jgi:hypothetical protein